MAKRFTDTEKWKKPFIRTMKAPYKLLWLYILDECDHAGIWQVDPEVAQLKIGEKIKLSEALNSLSSKIIVFAGGEKWFIPDFIDFQYGKLNPENRAHNSVIQILMKYNLLDGDYKPLTSPLQGAMDMDMDKDMVKDMDKDKEKEGEPKILLQVPFGDDFAYSWDLWKQFKNEQFKFQYKSVLTEQAAINDLMNLSGGVEEIAHAIIKQSISKGWKGFFELKNNQKNGSEHPVSKVEKRRREASSDNA
jgi:hypothetical protein